MTRRPRRILVTLLAASATWVALSDARAQEDPAPPADRPPDLIADPPERPIIEENFDVDPTDGTDPRRLLRFDGFIHNRSGAGPFEMVGTGPASLAMSSVVQRIRRSDGTWREVPSPAEILYETSDGHTHWHLKGIARYSLWQPDETAEVAPAQKTGFCLLDSLWAPDHDLAVDRRDRYYGVWPPLPPEEEGIEGHTWTDCETRNTTAPRVPMGVSAGWRDVYDRSLWFQWVDVSNVAPGTYVLRADVNPDGAVVESDPANAPGKTDVVVSGYVARPMEADVPLRGPTGIRLTVDEHKAAGEELAPPLLRIDRLPEHGRLEDGDGNPLVAGKWFSDPDVVFYPDPDLTEPVLDELRFVAREAVGTGGVSRYPLSPPHATVSLDIGGAAYEQVTISGERDVVAGSSTQLSVAVRNADPATVTWSVEPSPGGGTISPTGLYVAPDEPPPGGEVVVRATLPSGKHDEVRFRVLPEPPPEPAPTTEPPEEVIEQRPRPVLPPPAPAGGPPQTVAESRQGAPAPAGGRGGPVVRPTPALKLTVRRHTRSQIAASVLTRYRGRVTVALRRGRKQISRCRIQVRAQRLYVCRLHVRGRTGRLTVVATLTRASGRPLVRRASVTVPRPRRKAAARAHAHRH